MADGSVTLNGGHRNRAFHRRRCPDLCVPASCRCDWAYCISALFPALFLLYCSCSIRSSLRTRARVQGPTSSGVSLDYMASGRPVRTRSYALLLHSLSRSHWPEANPAESIGPHRIIAHAPNCRKIPITLVISGPELIYVFLLPVRSRTPPRKIEHHEPSQQTVSP